MSVPSASLFAMLVSATATPSSPFGARSISAISRSRENNPDISFVIRLYGESGAEVGASLTAFHRTGRTRSHAAVRNPGVLGVGFKGVALRRRGYGLRNR